MDYFLWEFSRGLYCSHGDHLIASKTFENFTKLASSDVHTLLVLSKFTNDIKFSSLNNMTQYVISMIRVCVKNN